MHRQLAESAKDRGMSKPNSILSKLALNRRLFDAALTRLTQKRVMVEQYRVIGPLMDQACGDYAQYFEQRCDEGHIKRCHGDLKTTNLWLQPASQGRSRQLLALDCIDFNPEFCHIDTLSDVAMLAADMEMRLKHCFDKDEDQQLGSDLVTYFLSTYLRELGETGNAVWPLLEYYTVEKAMVCAYMGILYRDEDESMVRLSEKYLEVALAHAKQLEKRSG